MPTPPHPETLHTLVAVVLVSLASLVGSVSLALGKRLASALPYLIGLATGALLGTACAHLLPEALAQIGHGRRFDILFITGFLGSFFFERVLFIAFRRNRTAHSHAEPVGYASVHHPYEQGSSGHLIIENVLLGAAVHSFVDGMAIATAFSVRHEIGIATTIAVLIHEVPHHVADIGVLIYSGLSKKRSVLLNLMATMGCATGGILVLLLGSHAKFLLIALLPITAANFIYIATAVLLPELQKEKNSKRSLGQISFLIGGLVLMFWLGH